MFLNAVNRLNQRGTVSLFSVTPEWVTINPQLQYIVEGRFFRAGLHELIVSDLIRARFRHFDVGDEVRIRGTPWKLVGAYHSTATAIEDSVIGDADTVLATFPQATFNVVDVVLESPDAFAAFKNAVVSDPTLTAEVKTQRESSEDIIKSRRKLLDFISFFLGGLMGLGAACGALASLYASVDARMVEIATLRAIGFGGLPVVSSVLARRVATGDSRCAARCRRRLVPVQQAHRGGRRNHLPDGRHRAPGSDRTVLGTLHRAPRWHPAVDSSRPAAGRYGDPGGLTDSRDRG